LRGRSGASPSPKANAAAESWRRFLTLVTHAARTADAGKLPADLVRPLSDDEVAVRDVVAELFEHFGCARSAEDVTTALDLTFQALRYGDRIERWAAEDLLREIVEVIAGPRLLFVTRTLDREAAK
jgi:hypothetical protein